MATEGAQTPNEYIVHHLTNLTYGEGFWTVNVDSVFFSVFLAVIFIGVFLYVARNMKSGTPTGLQSFVEWCVEGIDGLVRDTFPGATKIVAPLALTIFAWVFLFNAMDWLPVDLLPLIAEKGLHLEHLKVVPSTDLNITLGMAITVFLLCMFYSVKIKGPVGFAKELLTHPFGPWLFPANLVLNLVEHLARPVSLGLRLFGNLYAGEMIFLLLAVLGGSFAITTLGGIGAAIGHFVLGFAWSFFHILVIPLQAFVFSVLTIVYMAMAHETHDNH